MASTVPNRKNGRGGKRANAGRKPDYFKRLGIKALTAAEMLAHVNEPELWKAFLLGQKGPELQLKALCYLRDHRDGKAPMAVHVSGQMAHAHADYRDPRLAALSPDELSQLDAITKKLLPAASDGQVTAQDGPHNQIESKLATVAQVMDAQPVQAVLEAPKADCSDYA
jgi:hypothetical protein